MLVQRVILGAEATRALVDFLLDGSLDPGSPGPLGVALTAATCDLLVGLGADAADVTFGELAPVDGQLSLQSAMLVL